MEQFLQLAVQITAQLNEIPEDQPLANERPLSQVTSE
jgi:hypothetical protein